MIRAEVVYAVLERSGALAPACWQPARVGQPPAQASVRFLRAPVDTFDGKGQAFQATALMPLSVFAGLARGDGLTVTWQGQTLRYRVHELRELNDSQQREVLLKRAS